MQNAPDWVSLSNLLSEAEWTLEEIFYNAGSLEEAKRLAKEYLNDNNILRDFSGKHSGVSKGSS